jgi:hypothetical protein
MLDTLIENARVVGGICHPIWTARPVQVFSLRGRGRDLHPPGYDVTLFAPRTIGSKPPVFADDQPAGGCRLTARGHDIVATLRRRTEETA